MEHFVLSVFQLNTYVSDKLYHDPFLEEIWVQGEIGDLTIRHNTAYFVLSDGQASVDCMLFEFEQSGYADMIAEGQAVLLNGDISIYRKNGKFRIAVQSVQLTGLGELYAQFNLLKERLEQKGIFSEEHKQKVPTYPKKIGIVTSKEGAALQDIINIVRRRNPIVKLVLYPVKVQGAAAPAEIAAGIQYFNESTDVDVLIVGRGGGAAEDLFAFNDERVVMEVYHSNIPVISAVGHESDYSLCDMAADLRAPTPSAAAELAVPVKTDVLERIHTMKAALRHNLQQLIVQRKYLLEYELKKVSKGALLLTLETARRQLYGYRQQMKDSMNQLYNKSLLRYTIGKTKLDGLNPEHIFQQGYSVVTKNGFMVKKASGLMAGDMLEVRFSDGSIHARVEETE